MKGREQEFTHILKTLKQAKPNLNSLQNTQTYLKLFEFFNILFITLQLNKVQYLLDKIEEVIVSYSAKCLLNKIENS